MMKKTIISFLSIALTVSLAACSQPSAPANASSALESAASSDIQGSSAAAFSENDAKEMGRLMPTKDPVYVADAAVFRGVVEEFSVDEAGNTVLQMRKFQGARFVSTLKVTLNADTEYNFDSQQLANGVALEIYYSLAPDETQTPEIVDAIAVNLLQEEAGINYNGKLLAVRPNPEREGEGQLELALMDSNEVDFIFHYGPDTQFYLDFASLKQGDLLNIYHHPMMTMSIPPQSPALEVSVYTEIVEDEQDMHKRSTKGGTELPEDAQTYVGKVVSVQIDSTDPLSGRVEMTDMNGENNYIFVFDATLIQENIDVNTLKQGDVLTVQHSMISTRSLPPQSPAYSFAPATAK